MKFYKKFQNILINFIINFVTITFGYHKCMVLQYKCTIPINVYIVEY